MKYLKTVLKSIAYTFVSLLVLTTLITVLSYFDIVKEQTISTLKIIVIIISVIIGGFIVGKNTKKKGWLEGIKQGIILITIFFILTLLLKTSLNIKMLLYYVIIIVSSMAGSMIGISKKKS